MNRSFPSRGCAVLLLGALLLAGPARADWPSTPTAGVPVCTAADQQGPSVALADGAGGTYFAWIDRRAGWPETRVYAQHLCALGNPMCGADGILLAPFRSALDPPALARVTGGFGAIVVWRDFRADTAGNLYAQRFSPTGEALWDENGVPVNDGPLHEVQPVAASDGAGGAIIAWRDDRDGPAYQVRAQRLGPNGARLWDPDGIVVAPNPAQQTNPCIVPDAATGECGAVIAWIDWRGLSMNSYAQRLSAAGLKQWPAAGVLLSTATHGVLVQSLAPDGAGGAYAALLDGRSMNTWQQAFAQHVDRTGAVVWASDGISLSGSTWPVQGVQACADEGASAGGGAGVFIGWRDYENGGDNRVFAAHLDSAGATLASAPVGYGYDGNHFFDFSLASDGSGGALLAWNGLDGATYSVFAQRVDATVEPLWAPGGVTLARSSGFNSAPRIVPDGRGGAIAGWLDWTPAWSTDIYAARVDRSGNLGTAGVPPTAPPAALALSAGPSPVRSGGGVTLRLALPFAAEPRVALFDLAGRRVASLSPGAREAGLVTLRWDGRDSGGRSVPPGLYLARAEANSRVATARIVVTD